MKTDLQRRLRYNKKFKGKEYRISISNNLRRRQFINWKKDIRKK